MPAAICAHAGTRGPRALLPIALVLALAAAAPAWCRVVPPLAPAAIHPIWGTWKFTLADGICAETYHFRKDGTTVVTSGAQVTERAYEISAGPSARGYYRLVDRITRDNGKQDCTGALALPGRESTTYIRFHPSGAMLVFCESESLDNCLGPLNRLPEEAM